MQQGRLLMGRGSRRWWEEVGEEGGPGPLHVGGHRAAPQWHGPAVCGLHLLQVKTWGAL